jgi:sugar lactone lactonase YvrE
MNFVRTRVLLVAGCLAVTGAGAAELPAAAEAMKLAREATAAADEKDFPTYLAKMEAAAALRPDFPRILTNLAAAQLANDQPNDAIATLNRLAALGVHSPVDKSEEFAALRGRKEFKDVVAKLANNLVGLGEADIAFTVPDMTGVIEGIAWREKTGDFFFGDVHNRAVWLRTKDEKVRRFTAGDENLFGVFGLAVDEEHGALWAATSAVPAMHGYTDELDGAAGLAEFDLETGALRRVVLVPKTNDHMTHVIGDLALAPDGGIFLPDSGAPTLWRLAPGAGELEGFVTSPEFMSLQGVVVAPERNALLVADHANGLLRVDLSSREVRRLESPPDTTLIGLDGLVRAPNGDLIGIQNGLRPARVLRLALDAGGEAVTAVTVLESAHLNMPAPALGCVALGGDLYFIGNAGWSRFEGEDVKPTAPRPIPIFKTKLAVAPPVKKK